MERSLASLALPDLMGGARDQEAWQARRTEIIGLFEDWVFGRQPPGGLTVEVQMGREQEGLVPGAIYRPSTVLVTGPAGKASIKVDCFVPIGAVKTPCALLLRNRSYAPIDATRRVKTEFWPIEEITARGWAGATIDLSDAARDEADSYGSGVFGLFSEPRGPITWSVISAWAFAAQRAMDALAETPGIDPQRVMVAGHSRGGKTALWAAAQDERFAMAVTNQSGCLGSALSRGTTGETLEQITRGFPHWFSLACQALAHDPASFPVDQHMLLALIAPRPLYLASAEDDAWADPEGTFLAGLAASPAWELFGQPGLAAAAYPPVGVSQTAGQVAHHVRAGGHDLLLQDWMRFIDFAEARLGPP